MALFGKKCTGDVKMRNLILSLLIIPTLVFATPTSNRQLTGSNILNGAAILLLPTSSDTLLGRNTADTVTNKSIAAGSNTITGITNSSIAAGALIDFAKLATLSSGNLIVGSAGNVPTSVAVTGDVLISNAGVTTYNNVVSVAKGGTANGSLLVTNGGVLVTDGSKAVNSGAGTTGQVLTAGTPAAFATLAQPTFQVFTATGTTTGYWFTISSGNATIGATYTNNGQTFTVLQTVAAQLRVFTSGANAPLASGTLTKSAGTGDATLTFSAATPLATYTPTAATKLVKVTLVGAGGGSGGCPTCDASHCCATSGAGSGSVAIKWISNPTALFYAVGTGGAAGVAGNNNGVAGSPTAVVSATQALVIANGGGLGLGQAIVAAPAIFSLGAGGIQSLASGGDINIPGNSGSIGVCTSATLNANWGGNGGSTPGWGTGGSGGSTTANAGQLYGGGAAGTSVNPGISATAGAAGAGGIAVFEEYTQ